MNLNHWFVAQCKGGSEFLIKAEHAVEAGEVWCARRPEHAAAYIISWVNSLNHRDVQLAKEQLQYQIGMVNEATLPHGTIVLIS